MGVLFGLVVVAFLSYRIGRMVGRSRYAPPPEARERDVLTEALVHIGRGEMRAAVVALKQSMALYPDRMRPYMALGALYRQSGDPAKALRVHQNIEVSPLATVDQRLEAGVEMVLDLRALGREAEAAALLEQLSRRKVKGIDVNGHLGRVYLALGRWAEAYTHLHASMRRNGVWDKPVLARIQLMAGRAAVDAGDLSRALDHFLNAHDYAPELAGPIIGECEVFLSQGKPRKVGPRLELALERAPEEAVRILPLLQRAHDLLGTREAYEQFLVKALGSKPGKEFYLALARYLLANGREEEALNAFERAVALAPEDWTLRRQYLMLLKRQDRAHAQKLALELVERTPAPPVDADLGALKAFSQTVPPSPEREVRELAG